MPEPILAVSGLHAGYGTTEILRGVDLTVRQGEIVAVLGANGAGKSTLNQAISGLVRPWSGAIRFADTAIERERPAAIVAHGLIHVPEGRRIFPNMTVRENLDLGAYRRGRARRDPNRTKVFDFSAPGRTAEPARGHALRRRAADAGHRPGTDGRAKTPDPR